MKIHTWNERKAHTHTHAQRNTTRNMFKVHTYMYKTYSYLGTTTVRMDEVCASRRHNPHDDKEK